MRNTTLIAALGSVIAASAAQASVAFTYTSLADWQANASAGTGNAVFNGSTQLIDTLAGATESGGTVSSSYVHSWSNFNATSWGSYTPGLPGVFSNQGTMALVGSIHLPGNYMQAGPNGNTMRIEFPNYAGGSLPNTGIYGLGVAYRFVDGTNTAVSGFMTVYFSNGSNISIGQNTLTGTGFAGIWQADFASGQISAIVLSPSTSNGQVIVDTIYVGIVPAPGAVALVGVAGLIGSRRRRA
jgi:hypothetical protein